MQRLDNSSDYIEIEIIYKIFKLKGRDESLNFIKEQLESYPYIVDNLLESSKFKNLENINSYVYSFLIERGLENKKYDGIEEIIEKRMSGEIKRLPRGFLKNRFNRIAAFTMLSKKLGKPVKEIREREFNEYLGDQILRYYGRSLFKAFKEEGFVEYPWEMSRVDKWTRQLRREATDWLIKKTDKSITELTCDDFNNNNLSGLLRYYTAGKYSLYKISEDLGYDTKPWELKIVSRNYWSKKEKRVKTTEWLVNKLNKPAKKIISKDFCENGLYSLLSYYNGSSTKALMEAGLLDYEWEHVPVPQRFWKNPKNRVKAIEAVASKSFKSVFELTKRDIEKNNLERLLNRYYNNSLSFMKNEYRREKEELFASKI